MVHSVGSPSTLVLARVGKFASPFFLLPRSLGFDIFSSRSPSLVLEVARLDGALWQETLVRLTSPTLRRDRRLDICAIKTGGGLPRGGEGWGSFFGPPMYPMPPYITARATVSSHV